MPVPRHDRPHRRDDDDGLGQRSAERRNVNAFHVGDPSTYTYTGIPRATIKSYSSIMSEYGNEIVNGQGGAGTMDNSCTQNNGLPIAANDATIPSDPVVIARSVVIENLPGNNEAQLAPVIGTGPDSVVDDFSANLTVDPATYVQNPDYQPGPVAAPMFEIPDAWQCWGRLLNNADGEGVVSGAYSVVGMHGVQAFQRYGRLITVMGDAGQDFGGSLSFSSLKRRRCRWTERSSSVCDDERRHASWATLPVPAQRTHRQYARLGRGRAYRPDRHPRAAALVQSGGLHEAGDDRSAIGMARCARFNGAMR